MDIGPGAGDEGGRNACGRSKVHHKSYAPYLSRFMTSRPADAAASDRVPAPQ
jgi:hypothetical protein